MRFYVSRKEPCCKTRPLDTARRHFKLPQLKFQLGEFKNRTRHIVSYRSISICF